MKALAYLNKFLWKYKISLFIGFVCILISNLLKVYSPLIVGDAFDNISIENADKKSVNYQVFMYAIKYIGFYVISGIFLFLTRQTIIVTSRKIEFDLKAEIFDKYLKLDQQFYKRNRTGDIMNRISEDVTKVRMYLGPVIMYTLTLTITTTFVIYFMININKELTLYVLAPLPILSILIYFISNVMNRRSHDVQKQQSTLSNIAQESFSGIRVLKAYNRTDYSIKNFAKEIINYKTKVLRQVKVDAWFIPTIFILVGLSTISTIYFGGLKAISGEITIGNIAEFVFYINMLTWPFASLGWVTSLTQRAIASQQRINEFLNTEPTIKNDETKPIGKTGKVSFNNVSFTYPDSGIEALKNISFEVNKGKTLAIVGKTGSGKSTIASLIGRFYDPTSGNIEIENVNLKDINLNDYRQKIGYVPQDVFLFSDNIANNIAFGLKEFDIEQVKKAAVNAGVHENIQSFPDKYDTLLGERGINLSGGQKQRISIARAIIKNPEILIFDDCLSAVDTETEELILNHLKQIMKNKTSIIISHRISSIQHADEIIVLEKGEVIERGNHQFLIDKKGKYSEMYERQLLEVKK